MGMDYSKISEWIIREDCFDKNKLGKCEAIMSLGNGYLGLRSATEERYLNETRGLFVAGTFNKFDENEVTELPNAADMIAMKIVIDGENFSLTDGVIEEYARELNIRTGELKRNIIWISPKGIKLRLTFYRIVSLKRLHVLAQRVEITPLDRVGDACIEIKSGINGKMTNTGSQHFSEGDKRFYDKKVIQFVQTTGQSKIDFVDTTVHKLMVNENPLDVEAEVYIERREIFAGYRIEIKEGQTFCIEKYSTVYTSRDLDMEGKTKTEIQKIAYEATKNLENIGYQALMEESKKQWEEEVWNPAPIHIEGNELDEFSIHFAQYHLRLMVPAHDSRMNIGAKGLSGEGYKGHTFWDTEIFLLPYYIFTAPKTARKLEEYRYFSLPGARKKAKHNQYKGAMFPWESAWLDDGEVTPEYMDVDILTGKPNKVWSGFIEQHITSDVAFGVWQYSTITGDEDYMEKYGYELIMDTAIFWASRLEEGEDGKYHINDVVGPDEYREHVNDNAFTNYMAHWNMEKAVEYYDFLREEKWEIFDRLNQKLGLEKAYEDWKKGCEKIYLPTPTKENILPQDDRYLSCRDIDLSKYKAQEHVGGITRDYNLEQINQIQVSKQADVLVLFFLLEDRFKEEVKKASWKHYEARTLHDSSLSLSTHSVLACDMGQKDLAYDLFRKAASIDLGPFMDSSNAGIHAASFGGVWECIVYGFGGVRMLGGKLRINPSLPDSWTKLSYTIIWKGQKLFVEVTRDFVQVENMTRTREIEVEINGEMRRL